MEIWIPVSIFGITIFWIANKMGCFSTPSRIIIALASSSESDEEKDVNIENNEKKNINKNEEFNFGGENNSKKDQNSNRKINKKSNNSRIFWSSFFITIIILGIVYFIAINKAEKIKIDKNGKIVVAKELIEHFEKSLPQNFQHIERNIAINAKNDIDAIIDEEIDRLFEPVYDQIPKFSDFHYSLTGEYTEILAALTGRISKSIKTHLFDSIDFDDKFQYSMNNIIDKSNEVFLKAVSSTHNDIRKELNLNSKEFSLLSKSFVGISIDDMQKRFSNYIINGIRVGGVVSGAGAGAAAAALMAKKFGTKLVAKIVAKIATKLGFKVAGGAGAAATGASVGSFFGPAGTVVGGIIGAIVGWFAIDKVFIEIDQFINEEDFKIELTQLVTEQKQEIKDALKNLYANILNTTSDDFKNDLRNIKLKDYINSSN